LVHILSYLKNKIKLGLAISRVAFRASDQIAYKCSEEYTGTTENANPSSGAALAG
jgi:hypothetical protein